MSKTANSTVQQWGNSLAVRIPAALARKVHFVAGQPVDVSADDFGVVVHRKGSPKLSLEQKLAAFDPVKHGGEAMASGRIGAEVF
ncbi:MULTISPECIES: AbrB/MazE/SpoVT family DNA-binding domain-containing protein [unclassified Undibacterium]|nr:MULTISPECIES: AbrB/MazE/SpoVT family DNA-binding domain-containing protein [unclassified Undibacterium]MEB0138818.1 AbrB/MazE/SpoVT family DNA-binding domain-containing protein [Undibacterium sp. CCC2.1]MEB0170706.1 AbrB/MazE/SpoVT family DNA-binding domain-containing protein [Undibacterium sp. CCC1.1]MEB0174595.1 AbrB/MazE/SpoVT family DNA-binding domain-containing protein [Undibacterium sp. CCC3.4]MEB0213792.1 AbrB/MazE/SpoVT family DNA-binding domain-containing protein [Undibacterium sp. 